MTPEFTGPAAGQPGETGFLHTTPVELGAPPAPSAATPDQAAPVTTASPTVFDNVELTERVWDLEKELARVWNAINQNRAETPTERVIHE